MSFYLQRIALQQLRRFEAFEIDALSPGLNIIAGPNGAGKTTFAREYLPNEAATPMFVNADLIAAGLSPFDPDVAAIQAGRLMLEQSAAG